MCSYPGQSFEISSLTGGGTTDVTPMQDQGPTMSLSLVWITTGAVALAVLVAVCSTICFCGVQRRRKHKFDSGSNTYSARNAGTREITSPTTKPEVPH